MNLSSEVDAFIKDQVNAIDNILLNAHGTVYKFAVKQIICADIEYLVSRTEEILSAKNLVSNLWSVLDFCCTILYSYYNNRLPTLKQGMQIKFPCYFSKTNETHEEWEKKRLETMLQPEVSAEMLSSLSGIFQHVQLKNVGEDADNSPDVYYFYLLHFLRNTLTINSINIDITQNHEELVPDVLKQLDKVKVHRASVVRVPTKPWVDFSRDDRSTYIRLSCSSMFFTIPVES